MAVQSLRIINNSGNLGTDYDIIADDVGTGKIQLVKLDLGAIGASSPATGSLPVTVEDTPLALRYDEGATYTYIGEAAAGSLTASAVWRVKRLTNADNTIIWADGNTNQDNIWDNRVALTYS